MFRLLCCLAGVVGASYSSVSAKVSMILQAYNISAVSYASTAIELSDKQLHPLFARTVPSDIEQVFSPIPSLETRFD